MASEIHNSFKFLICSSFTLQIPVHTTHLQSSALTSGNLSDLDIFVLAGEALLSTDSLEQQSTTTSRLLSECAAGEMKSFDPF